jgi:hypothetical protein
MEKYLNTILEIARIIFLSSFIKKCLQDPDKDNAEDQSDDKSQEDVDYHAPPDSVMLTAKQ